MPITNITIENFKGISTKTEIPIRPITLLFGANSAGKSTILQALLYMRELLEGANPNADHLGTGGQSLDLGGFCEFVHNRKTTRGLMTTDCPRSGGNLHLSDDKIGFDLKGEIEIKSVP